MPEITITGASLVASITVWNTGSCDIDVLSYETGDTVLAERLSVPK